MIGERMASLIDGASSPPAESAMMRLVIPYRRKVYV